MEQFAKVFDLPARQALFFKDFINTDEGDTVYQIVFMTCFDGCTASLAFGYEEDEERRDAQFELLTPDYGQQCIDSVAAAFAQHN